MEWKSIKVRENVYNKLLELDKSPSKAIEGLLGTGQPALAGFQVNEKDWIALKKRIDRIEDFIFEKSGNNF